MSVTGSEALAYLKDPIRAWEMAAKAARAMLRIRDGKITLQQYLDCPTQNERKYPPNGYAPGFLELNRAYLKDK